MTNTQIESQVMNHLGFLGYEVKPVPSTDMPEKMRMLRAEHPNAGSINIMLFEGVVDFSIWFGLNDLAMKSRQGLLEVVNGLNGQFATRYFIGDAEGAPACFCNLSYRGPYEKRAFGQFVNVWQSEIQALWGTDIMKFLA